MSEQKLARFRMKVQKPDWKRVAETLRAVAPGIQNVLEDDTLWQRREELYRTTFILGRFHWYRKFRVWWIRRQLRRV
jgi:hypothetical protein